VKIIIETIFGLLLLVGVFCAVGWFLFREQFQRLIKYFRLWAEQDAKREAREAKLRENLKTQQRETEMREAAARERAEAEIDDIESGSQL